MSVFKYSGSKTRLLKHLPPPKNASTIVEPFAGSAAYSIHYRPDRLLLCEKNTSVRALWEWLRAEATTDDLHDLERLPWEDRSDVRDLKLPVAPETLLRLTASGVMVGQLSSFILLRQNTVNFDKLKAALPWIKKAVGPVGADFRDYQNEPGFHFVDPPYLKTSGNYVDKKAPKGDCGSIDLDAVMDYCRNVRGLLTYGHDAKEVMPSMDWKLAKVVKVPKIRTGGTKDRHEHFCFLGSG